MSSASRSSLPPRGLVGQDHHAGPERLRPGERQGLLLAVTQQRLAAAYHHRMDRQPELVDEPVLEQRLRQAAVPVQRDVPASRCLSRVTSATASPLTMVELVQAARSRVAENTYLRMLLIRSASSPSCPGQTAENSSYVPRPMSIASAPAS